MSNQRMNSYLKELADLCGITKELTFHSARHTFATTVTLTIWTLLCFAVMVFNI
jgi:site-specific recombinase XerD